MDSPEQARFCRVTPPLSAGTQIKFNGTYPLPAGIKFSATYQNLPGIPITASYVATNAQIASSLGRNLAACGTRTPCVATTTVELIEPGTLYEDRFTQIDLRLGKTFNVGRFRVQGMFDVYNVLNASPVLAMNTRYGPAWLTPGQILVARMFKVGGQVDF